MDRKKFWAFLVVFAVWGTLFLLAAKFYFKKFGFFLPEWRVGDFVYFFILIIIFLFYLGGLVKFQKFGKIVLTGFSFFFVPFFLAFYPYKLRYENSVLFSVMIPIFLALIPDFIDSLKEERKKKDDIPIGELNMLYAAFGSISSYMFWVPLVNGALWLWKAAFGAGLTVSIMGIVCLFVLFWGIQKVMSVFISLHRWIFTAPSE